MSKDKIERQIIGAASELKEFLERGIHGRVVFFCDSDGIFKVEKLESTMARDIPLLRR